MTVQSESSAPAARSGARAGRQRPARAGAGRARARTADDRLAGALLITAPEPAPDERDLLLQTLSAWLASGGSAGQTAALLYCHRNTVLNRLRRLEALTGRSCERVDDLV